MAGQAGGRLRALLGAAGKYPRQARIGDAIGFFPFLQRKGVAAHFGEFRNGNAAAVARVFEGKALGPERGVHRTIR